MDLTRGTRLGPYEIGSQLGAGGMGIVYRARDTKLQRDVALKVLPDIFATDPERLARFQREAQVLASLNHPNIAAIYGLEEADPSTGPVLSDVRPSTSSGRAELAEARASTGSARTESKGSGPAVRALVLELVEGPTLAERLTQQSGVAPAGPAQAGPHKRHGRGLPLSDALPIARQIAEALDAAHERGIVHRDLKPANVKVKADGTVKVLDFGLAKLVTSEAGDAGGVMSQAPTATAAGTRHGTVLGTAAYMSPEQARGQPVDKRTDIWAFGCVLYEMLTGRRAFSGETTSDTIAAILGPEPDWAALPETTTAGVRRLLQRCLEKDPKRRMRDIGDARVELEEPVTASVARATRYAGMSVSFWMGIALTVAAVGVGAMLGRAWFRATPAATTPTQFTFEAPNGVVFESAVAPVAPSPDGTRIAFVARDAEGAAALWIRRVDSVVPQRLAGTEGARGPFWSPDGRSVGFFADGKLKRIDPAGGPALNICSVQTILGATWNRDNVIVLAPFNRIALHRVSADGGTPQPITALDTNHRENSHRWPHFLPDGRHFLFTARSDVRENTVIYVGSLDSNETRRLLAAQSNAVYAPPGYLLFAREGTLMAQRFDAQTLSLSGSPFPVAAGVNHVTPSAWAAFATSADGILLTYQDAVRRAGRLTWFDRVGANLGSIGSEHEFTDVKLAPNAKQAAVAIPDRDSGNRDIWLMDLAAGALTRLTSHPANDWQMTWAPDGAEIVFASDRNGASSVYRKATNGGSDEELLLQMNDGVFPRDWSPDGRFLILGVDTMAARTDIWALPLMGGGKPFPVVQTSFSEDRAIFSPDGQWIAYESDESGATEVYVQPFGRPRGKTRISTSGGQQVRWRRDGRELFYVTPSGELMAVTVNTGDAFEAGVPSTLFRACTVVERGAPASVGRAPVSFDVAPDGLRFLMLCAVPESRPSSVTVVLHWTRTLKQ